MRTRPTSTWQSIFNNHDGNLDEIFKASMRGDKSYDKIIIKALTKDRKSPKSGRRYQLWCEIISDFKIYGLAERYLQLSIHNLTIKCLLWF